MNCKKRCGHCSKHSCDFDNGKCEPCSDNYVGAKCDIRTSTSFLNIASNFLPLQHRVKFSVNLLLSSDIKYSEAKVKVENFELLNKKYTDPPYSYYVEYRVR
jgi:hypothetical protein